MSRGRTDYERFVNDLPAQATSGSSARADRIIDQAPTDLPALAEYFVQLTTEELAAAWLGCLLNATEQSELARPLLVVKARLNNVQFKQRPVVPIPRAAEPETDREAPPRPTPREAEAVAVMKDEAALTPAAEQPAAPSRPGKKRASWNRERAAIRQLRPGESYRIKDPRKPAQNVRLFVSKMKRQYGFSDLRASKQRDGSMLVYREQPKEPADER